jgi:putative Mg2+ transporter-C (MgtC) family protein
LFTLISCVLVSDFAQYAIDPTRIAAGIVTGIGFLCAGAIIQSKGEVLGLTTAASVWVVAAIGMAIGYGLFILAGGTTILTLIILYFLEKIELKVNGK